MYADYSYKLSITFPNHRISQIFFSCEPFGSLTFRVYLLVGWLVGRSVGRWVVRRVDRLVGWMVSWLVRPRSYSSMFISQLLFLWLWLLDYLSVCVCLFDLTNEFNFLNCIKLQTRTNYLQKQYFMQIGYC